ncbi:MAG TPA: alkaline phosphatase family protein, partial [Planctomycetota bacterium]|nr:alkaline phosphatase family protein [Planctomycetota bacterium]
MSRLAALVLLVVVAAAHATALSPPADPAPAARPAGPVPKTVILGFDGMDYALTQRFMDAGLMPHFKRLAEQGLFQKLDTSNPAQSPVSWAVFNTGCNPGKTGVAGFVSRVFMPGRGGALQPTPQMMLGFNERIPADDFVEHPLALTDPHKFRYGAMWAAGAAGLVVGLILFKLLFRLGLPVATLLSLLLAGGGAWAAQRWAAGY